MPNERKSAPKPEMLEARIAVLEALVLSLAQSGATEGILDNGFHTTSSRLKAMSERLKDISPQVEPLRGLGSERPTMRSGVPAVSCGLYRAVVLDNLDPEQRGRLQIQVPGLSAASPPWAEACALSTQLVVPSIGDTVWSMFEAGDVRRPVWIGTLPGRAA